MQQNWSQSFFPLKSIQALRLQQMLKAGADDFRKSGEEWGFYLTHIEAESNRLAV